MTGDDYDLSFSGLKTAVVRATEKHHDLAVADVAASFQAAVAEQLLRKLRGALEHHPVKGLALAGGVAANSALARRRAANSAQEFGIEAHLPTHGDVHRQRRDDRGRRDVPTASDGASPWDSRPIRTGSWRTSRERDVDPLELAGLRPESLRPVPTVVRRGEGRDARARRHLGRRPRRPTGGRARAWCCCVTSTTTSVGWYTNYESRKGHELEDNPDAAILWYCEPLGRQVRMEGAVEKMTAAESDAYFATRARGSQLGAHASAQST